MIGRIRITEGVSIRQHLPDGIDARQRPRPKLAIFGRNQRPDATAFGAAASLCPPNYRHRSVGLVAR
jgi:hypothetical protein